MLKKFCRCGKIIPQDISMCSECESKLNNRQKKVYKDYRKRRVDFKEQKFYCSKEWKFTRDSVRQRDEGTCKLCDDELSDVVHHIETLKDCWSKRLNMNNLICLWDRCHKKVHRMYEKGETSKIKMQNELKELIKENY